MAITQEPTRWPRVCRGGAVSRVAWAMSAAKRRSLIVATVCGSLKKGLTSRFM